MGRLLKTDTSDPRERHGQARTFGALITLLMGRIADLETRLEAAEADTAALQERLAEAEVDRVLLDFITDLKGFVKIRKSAIPDTKGLQGPHMIFHGCNVHIQNGSRSFTKKNGLGNLVIGYNKAVTDLTKDELKNARNGSQFGLGRCSRTKRLDCEGNHATCVRIHTMVCRRMRPGSGGITDEMDAGTHAKRSADRGNAAGLELGGGSTAGP